MYTSANVRVHVNSDWVFIYIHLDLSSCLHYLWQVYELSAARIIHKVKEGFNGCIFAYVDGESTIERK